MKKREKTTGLSGFRMGGKEEKPVIVKMVSS